MSNKHILTVLSSNICSNSIHSTTYHGSGILHGQGNFCYKKKINKNKNKKPKLAKKTATVREKTIMTTDARQWGQDLIFILIFWLSLL